MFDLENAIHQWRRRFNNEDSVTTENLHELEEHLRESLARLANKGLNQEEAFLVATTRLGHPVALNGEYRKANGTRVWQKRILWMLCGYVGGSAFSGLLAGIGSLGSGAVGIAGFAGAPAGAVSIAIRAMGWVVLLALACFLAKARHSGTRADRMSFAWSLSLLAIILFGRGLGALGSLLHSHTVSVSDYGVFCLWRSVGGLVIHFCVLLVCVGMILAFSDPRNDGTEVTA